MKRIIEHLPCRGHKLGVAFVLMIAAVLYACAAAPRSAGFFHDDAIYIITAKALAEGKGYRIVSLPQILPQTKYPIFYPFLLSLLWRIHPDFPNNLLVMKLVSVVASVSFLYLAYRFLIRFEYAPPGTAGGILTLTAFSPWVLEFSSSVLSEMPYALLSMIALYLVEWALSEGLEPRKRWTLITMASAGAGLACLTRSVGLALVAGIFLYLIHRRAWKMAGSFFAFSSVLVVPWNLWAHLQLRHFAPGSSLEIYYVSYLR